MCSLSLNNISEEYKLAFGFLLPLKCLLDTLTALRLLWHIIAMCFFIMQTLHPLETRLNLLPYSKQQITLFSRTWGCIWSKKCKWGKNLSIHLQHFCWSAHRPTIEQNTACCYSLIKWQQFIAVGVPEKCFLSPMATSSLHGTNCEQILLYFFMLFVFRHSSLLQSQQQRNDNSGARWLWQMHVVISPVIILWLPFPNSWLCMLISCTNL